MDSVGTEFPQGQQMFMYVLMVFSMASSGFRLLLSKSADSACVIFLEHFRGYCIKKRSWDDEGHDCQANEEADNEKLEEIKVSIIQK